MSHYLPGYSWLIERSRRLRYDSRAIIARYDEHIEDVPVDVFYALALRALARLTGDDSYAERAARTERALIELCWGEERGLFWHLAGSDHTPPRVSTWSSLAPLAMPSLPETIARRLIEEHLLHPRRYRAPFGIPSVSMEERSFQAGRHLFRCWRGPAWIHTVWLLVPALRRFGYDSDANRIVASCIELVGRHGFRE
jgi:glycogen debranching enzyme